MKLGCPGHGRRDASGPEGYDTGFALAAAAAAASNSVEFPLPFLAMIV